MIGLLKVFGEVDFKKESNMEISQLKAGSHIHLMGICGTAMASLAGLLKDKGFHVTGSDANPYPPMSTQIESLGIRIHNGYQAENLKPAPDYVIVGNVISKNNPEAVELFRLGIPFTSLPQAMGNFIIGQKQSVVVAGTHGKTTTTSLMTWVLETLGEKPGFMIGGIPKNFSQSFRNGHNKYFVIEGDEYDTAFFDKVPKFVHYKPYHVILTSVEFDHADIYANLEAVKDAFRRLIDLSNPQGQFICCADDKNIQDLLKEKNFSRAKTYGFGPADYQILNVKKSEVGVQFEIYFENKPLLSLNTTMTGDYNLLNITAVVGLSHQLGLNLEKVSQAILTFEGVKRRQDILGEPDGVLIIEDFAHHPTAVRETVKGVQAKYSQRKVFSVFEPRSASSRRKVFQKDYQEAFMEAQEVILAQAFDQSKIDAENRFSSEEMVGALVGQGKKAQVLSNADAIVAYLVKESQPGDVILIMSNGGFDGIYQKLMAQLTQRSSARLVGKGL